MAIISSVGAVPTSTVEYVELLGQAFREAYPGIDLSVQTPQGQLVALLAHALGQRDVELVTVLSQMSIWSATGTALDDIANLMGVTRNADETDTELRDRYFALLGAHESGTRRGLISRVLAVDGVTQCVLSENATDAEATVRLRTLPANSIEIYVDGGASADIAQAISRYKPLGIPTHGDVTVSVTHENGTIAIVKFTRIADINVAASVQLTTSAGWPSNGAALVGAALKSYFDTLRPGQSIDTGRASAAMYNAAQGFVQGTTTYTQVGGTAIPAALAFTQHLKLATDNITITLQSA